MACLQYEVVLNQLQSTIIATKLQKLGVDSQILQADSALEMAKLNKKYQNLSSPINGVVTSVSAEEGNLVGPGQILAKVENLNKLAIKTSVNEEEAALISVGDDVKVKTDSKTLSGEIISISPALNELSKKIHVEIKITKDSDLTPGSFVKIAFSPQPKNTIFIPLNSISLSTGEKTVKTINENLIVVCKTIETGQIIGDYIEITSGLNGNEKIVKSITTFIEDGEKVALKD
jgi:RND family efflux transporter MFP subunit